MVREGKGSGFRLLQAHYMYAGTRMKGASGGCDLGLIFPFLLFFFCPDGIDRHLRCLFFCTLVHSFEELSR